MKKLSKIFAVVLVLALALAMIPTTFAAECPLVDGAAYTISAANGTGTLYFDGTVSSGRFNGTYTEAEAAAVYIEVVTGGYKMYIMDGSNKKYINISDSSTGGSLGTSAAEATVYEWNSSKNTLAVAEDSNNRAFGCGATSTYANFSCYDLSGSYNWGQFTAYAPAQDTREDLPTAVADILAAIYALADGETLDKYYKYESFTLSGVVDGDTTWNDQYGDGQVTFKVDGTDKELLAYQFKAGSIDAAVAKALATGDKVTFTVTEAKNYGGTFEIVKATLTAVEKATNDDTTGGDNTTGGDTGVKDPDKVGDNTAIVAMTSVMAIAVVALAVLVIGKKRMF